MRDLTGKTYAKWTVLSFDGYRGNYFWWCQCECGKIRSITQNGLINGKSKSCGHHENLTGRKFGKLTVIEFDSMKINKSTWRCLCECGNETVVFAGNLLKGVSTSCGCFQKENSSIICSETRKNNRNRYNYKWYFYDKNRNKIFCSSSYEVIFWNYFCHIRKENILYEPETFKIENGKRYTPDFYLPDKDMWVETKGSFNAFSNSNIQKIKVEYFSINHNIEVYFWKDLVKVCELPYSSQDTYKNKSYKLNLSIEDYFANMFYVGV